MTGPNTDGQKQEWKISRSEMLADEIGGNKIRKTKMNICFKIKILKTGDSNVGKTRVIWIGISWERERDSRMLET
jgi:hypothetical protein